MTHTASGVVRISERMGKKKTFKNTFFLLLPICLYLFITYYYLKNMYTNMNKSNVISVIISLFYGFKLITIIFSFIYLFIVRCILLLNHTAICAMMAVFLWGLLKIDIDTIEYFHFIFQKFSKPIQPKKNNNIFLCIILWPMG